jgi:hypothetical protein
LAEGGTYEMVDIHEDEDEHLCNHRSQVQRPTAPEARP